MSRPSQPWRRGGTKGPWYAQLRGKQEYLAPPEATKTEAREVLDGLRAEIKAEKRRPGGLTFKDAIQLFIAHVETAVERKDLSPTTLRGYVRFLVPAAVAIGRHPAASLTPAVVQSWLDGRAWGPTTRNNAVTAVLACLNWARRMGHLAANPLRDMPKPKAQVTESDLTAEQMDRIVEAATDRQFRDFLRVMRGTGARPSEAMRLEASHLDLEGGRAVLPGKTTRKTGRLRTVYLSGDAREVLARLAEAHPTGVLLRNRRGSAWTPPAIGTRFRRLRAAIGMGPEATAKMFRHGFATDALVKGVSVSVVAELLGHTSTKMVDRTYSKLRKRTEHLRDAVEKIRPDRET